MLARYPVAAVVHLAFGNNGSVDRVLEDMKLIAPVAALVLALALAACGSSDTKSSSKAIVASANKAKVGRVIVDAQGRTLYRFTAEAQGRPVCTGACVSTWLPATVSRASGLPAHVATVKRDDGALQLTYDGHPLYRYAGDSSTADANGQGVGGQWFVLKSS
jgi:predicted lipoprotein with Yx(FWY)xxD motif